MMTRTATMIGGLVVAIAAAVVPPPQQLLNHPKVQYGAAMVKVLSGDAEGALRLVQESSAPAPEKPATRTASACRASHRG